MNCACSITLSRRLAIRKKLYHSYYHQFSSSVGIVVRRHLSSRKRDSFQLDALPFTVAPSEAYAKFQRWANDEQGLGPLLSYIGSSKITAAYSPFWYFDLNVRFIIAPTTSRRGGIYLATPEPFKSAYPSAPNGVIHIPGLAAYAGFSYRRSLIDPVHNTTPVFLKKDIVPFGQWMLEPLKYGNEQLEIYPDPWNATRERAYSVVCDELHDMANEQYQKSNETTQSQVGTPDEVIVETERLSARRIYMPTYIVEYTILGITYRACISGCDPSIQVSGVSHKTMFSSGSKEGVGALSMLSKLPQGMASTAAGAFQIFGPRPFVAIAQAIFALVSRIAMRFHIVGILGGIFVAYKKLFQPYLDATSADAEGERQRANESQKSGVIREDSFRDSGSAKSYFIRNEAIILRRLSEEEGRRTADSSEWYHQWEQWAREQWEKAQREAYKAQKEWQRQQQQQQGKTWNQYQQSSQQQQQQQQQRQYKQAKKDDDFRWDFDVNDPWSVLGIPRNSSKDEVSKAFRRVSCCNYRPTRSLHLNLIHTRSHPRCLHLYRKCSNIILICKHKIPIWKKGEQPSARSSSQMLTEK